MGRYKMKTCTISGNKFSANTKNFYLNKCWIDAEATKKGLEALLQYRSSYDDKKKIWSQRPVHDWTSHASDAFRYLCVTDVVFTGNDSVWAKELPKTDLSWIVQEKI